MRRNSRWDFVLIFAAGFVWDALLSVDTIWTAHFSAIGASFSTISVTMLSYFMYDRIREETGVNWRKAWTLAIGSGLGAGTATYLLSL